MLDSVWNLALGAMFGSAGVDAVVTRPAPDDTPIPASLLWVTPTTDDAPTGSDFHRREPHEVAAIQKSDVPTMPRQTRIVAERTPGAGARTWSVDRVVVDEPDLWRVLVIPTDK